jgi:hypothetical protein
MIAGAGEKLIGPVGVPKAVTLVFSSSMSIIESTEIISLVIYGNLVL